MLSLLFLKQSEVIHWVTLKIFELLWHVIWRWNSWHGWHVTRHVTSANVTWSHVPTLHQDGATRFAPLAKFSLLGVPAPWRSRSCETGKSQKSCQNMSRDLNQNETIGKQCEPHRKTVVPYQTWCDFIGHGKQNDVTWCILVCQGWATSTSVLSLRCVVLMDPTRRPWHHFLSTHLSHFRHNRCFPFPKRSFFLGCVHSQSCWLVLLVLVESVSSHKWLHWVNVRTSLMHRHRAGDVLSWTAHTSWGIPV